jgi:hypothetical protein
MEELRKRTYDTSNGDQFPMGQSVVQDDSTEMKYSRIHHSETLLLMAVLIMYLEVVVCAHASSEIDRARPWRVASSLFS